MRREERVTVQGPVKEQEPDGMSHRGVRGGVWWCWGGVGGLVNHDMARCVQRAIVGNTEFRKYRDAQKAPQFVFVTDMVTLRHKWGRAGGGCRRGTAPTVMSIPVV